MLFSNKKKQKVTGKNEARDKIAKNSARYFILSQTKWAAWMQRKTERMSGKGKVMALILFCMLAGGNSIYIATSSFSGKQAPPFSVGSIKQPKYIQNPDDEKTRASVSISEEEYQRIHRFKLYMDSLAIANGPSGKNLFDSITTARPGLIDSILIIENRYQSQTKK